MGFSFGLGMILLIIGLFLLLGVASSLVYGSVNGSSEDMLTFWTCQECECGS